MAKWKYSINLAVEYAQAKNGTITHPEYAKKMATRLRALPVTDDDELEVIIALLEHAEDTKEIDTILHRLYDWADADHKLWIETRLEPKGVQRD